MGHFKIDELLTAAELAALLRIKPEHVEKLAERGDLPYHIVENNFMFDVRECEFMLSLTSQNETK